MSNRSLHSVSIMNRKSDMYLARTSRKPHKKSRLGCANCKRRKIKCDEIKPQCAPCLRHSVVCDYTLQPQQECRSQTQADRSRGVESKDSKVIASAPSMLENQYRFISSSTVEFKPPKRQLGRQTQENDTLSPSSTASSAAPCTAVWEPPFLFSGPDMELFHHYMTCTSMTLADDEAGRKLMQSTLPQLGFRYNHVLRLLLAFAGYHVAHLRQRRRQDKQPEGEILSLSDTSDESVVTQADQNYTIALSQVRTDIPTLNETTCHAIYASAVFICFCSFAKGPQAGQYLGFSEDAGSAEWLTLLGGVRSIIQYSKDVLSVDLVSAEISNSSLDQYMGDPHADVEHPRAGWAGCLQQLRDLLIQEFSICHSSYAIYLTVLDGLASSFNKVYGTEHERLCRGDRWAQIFRWLYTLPGVFVSDLQEHRPPALLLFSPFVVLLKDLESYWFVHGWPEHILAGIYRMLSVRHRTFLTWQMEQVGWNP